MNRSPRRQFLKASIAAGAIAALFVSGLAGAFTAPAASPATDPVEYFNIRVTNNLHEAPAFARLNSGETSEVMTLSGNETYRVKVSLTDRDSVFGPMYNVELLQGDGTPLDSMLAGLTATFQRYGVQVLLMPVTKSQAAARAVSQL